MSLNLKKQLLSKMLENFEAEMNVMAKAAAEAREAATHEESIAEDKYDTRGLEASYLAGAQAKRAAELQLIIHSLQSLELNTFDKDSPISMTALAEVSSNLKSSLYFIAPKGGGMNLNIDNKCIQVITPDSRLGKELMGKHAGDTFELKIAERLNDYEILKVY
ncbi:MAG: transcription elongation factor GreAB [Bdellovibrionota bacterium]